MSETQNTQNETVKNTQEKPYEKYVEQFKSINLFSIIQYSITILLVLLALFLPIFQNETTISISDYCATRFKGDIEAEINFLSTLTPEEILSGEMIVKENFSIWNEFIFCIKGFSNLSDSMASFFSLYSILFPFFDIMMGTILIIFSAKTLYGEVNNKKDLKNYSMLEYNQIKKSGGIKEKKSFIKGQSAFSFIMYIIFTIIFGKIEGTIFELMGEIGEGTIAPSPMSQFSGFNFILFVILIIVAGLSIFFMFKTKSLKNKVITTIVQEEYNK